MIREQREYSTLSNHIEAAIMRAFLSRILSNVEIREVASSDNTKQQCLVDTVEALSIPSIDRYWFLMTHVPRDLRNS